MTPAEQLQEKVASLSEALLTRHPLMSNLLRDIHKTIQTYPEQVTLLSESEIATIVSGLQAQTGISFAANALKASSSKSATAKLKSLGADAF